MTVASWTRTFFVTKAVPAKTVYAKYPGLARHGVSDECLCAVYFLAEALAALTGAVSRVSEFEYSSDSAGCVRMLCAVDSGGSPNEQ